MDLPTIAFFSSSEISEDSEDSENSGNGLMETAFFSFLWVKNGIL